MIKETMTDPQQKKGGPRLWLLLIGVLLVVGLGLLGWQVFAHQVSTPSNTMSTNTHFSATLTPVSKGTLPEVASRVRQQVAQQLQLSADQLTARLQAGTPIETLATQQGMSADEWRTFVITTYQAAYNQAVSAGQLTQARADHDMRNIRSYPPDALNSWVTNDCLGITAS
jgi:hypothetical protein